MNRNTFFTAAVAAALGFCAGLGAAGCVISAFGLRITAFPALILICLTAAVFSALAFSRKRGTTALLLILALLAGYLWRRGEAWAQLKQLVYRLSYVYDQAYHWGYLPLTELPWNAGAADLPMAIWGALTAMAVCWCVCRRHTALFPFVLDLVTLAPCVVVTDTVPASGCLVALLVPLLLLLLSSHARRSDPGQGCRLILLAALPVTAALLGLLLAVPQERYVNQSDRLRDALWSWCQSLLLTPTQPVSLPAQSGAQVNLAALDSRRESTAPVLYVTAETGGTLYLRGQDYDVYDGKRWQSTPHRAEDFSCDGTDLGSVTVKTLDTEQVLYLPYYPEPGLTFLGGRLENSRLSTQYTYRRTGLAADLGTLLAQAGTGAGTTGGEDYLALPQATLSKASALAAGLFSGETTATAKAEVIGAYVRNSAVYDLNTGRMPEGEPDFALWFLEQSDRGYCVHFATAAAVLLRAAGVEARYVSGYLVRTRAGETVSVTGENAHAWVEYYEPALGLWLILEATPGATDTVPASQTVTEPSEAPATSPATTLPAVSEEPEDLPQTAPQTAPAQSPPPEPASKHSASGLWISLLVLTVAIALAEGQRRLRLKLRRENAKSVNAQALARWREVERLAQLRRESPPEALEALAQKAKFSQHTLTGEELLAFEAYRRKALRALRQRPWYFQLLYRYLYALY